MILDTIGAIILVNMLEDKGFIWADKGAIKAGQGTGRVDQDF